MDSSPFIVLYVLGTLFHRLSVMDWFIALFGIQFHSFFCYHWIGLIREF